MRVDNENDRMKMPEECDRCGYPTDKLVRHSHYGPGYQVDWLCRYCEVDFTRGNDDIVKSIAGMFNTFEEIILKTLGGSQ